MLLSSFKKVKSGNFIFVCDTCITKRENQEASSINDQIVALTDTVNKLASKFKTFITEKVAEPNKSTEMVNTPLSSTSW